MRYTIEVQHRSDLTRDGKWYLLSQTDDAGVAVFEYLKFQESYGRPVRIRDAKYARMHKSLRETGQLPPEEVWIVRGVTSGLCDDGVPAGLTEWQFSDGPAGHRGSSNDYLSLEEGLKDYSGCIIHWGEHND